MIDSFSRKSWSIKSIHTKRLLVLKFGEILNSYFVLTTVSDTNLTVHQEGKQKIAKLN